MTHSGVAIIGGGLAGLHAAWLLHRGGVDFHLFEARDRLGGRILTVDASGTPADDGFDLGPSWFWPLMQPAIGALVSDLGLPSFVQNSTGDVVFERMSREGPQRYPTPPQDSHSLRLVGGSAALIRRLARDLPPDRIHLDTPVKALALEAGIVTVTLPDRTLDVAHVIAALPPRLLQGAVRFSPGLPAETDRLWRSTPTWMAPHAKFFALYDHPFWRASGCSGTAQSMVGPMPEIHDATTAAGAAALFGFLGIGAADRVRIGSEALEAACIDQLVRLFGPDAASPRATLYKDWAADPMTATPEDWLAAGHPEHAERWVDGLWSDVLTMAGSESSPNEAGYLAGAVEASRKAAVTLLDRLGQRASP